ncbi:DUF5366 family protein [Ureibacillus sinduriensis]|uniref:Membrane protein n=1 Tax=Ureibacillus sinduriensis BLB-1 = JCM 15800 TaxID=1384057 RepID=A0A0A3HR09_9BACL|nr:DUF5366 family protein [Ureibacillus sinduriensis]KGR75041.1 membrane protein [Ureibacillus sinduriensis BLB-1 = JCM 15800]
MKNPYLYGYLPLFSVILFSLTYGIYLVGESLELLTAIGVYTGMREFLTDIELRLLLLSVFALCFFMLFSALKLIGETIHEVGMLLFSKDNTGEMIGVARGGYLIFFFGSLLSIFGIQSILILLCVFALTIFSYFTFHIYKMSRFLTLPGTIGLIFFEILMWAIFITFICYVVLKLYNGLLASLPFTN